jgi:hypothetical protein
MLCHSSFFLPRATAAPADADVLLLPSGLGILIKVKALTMMQNILSNCWF